VDFFRWWDGRYAVVEDLSPPEPGSGGPVTGPVPGFDPGDADDPDLSEYD